MDVDRVNPGELSPGTIATFTFYAQYGVITVNTFHGAGYPAARNNVDHPDDAPGGRAPGRRVLGGLMAGALAGSGLLLGATPAHAATGVAVVNGVLRVESANGKANDITVASRLSEVGVGPSSYLVEDKSDTLVLGSGCTRVNTNAAICSATGVSSVEIDTKDLNDRITLKVGISDGNNLVAPGIPAVVRAGDGDDIVRGGVGDDRLYGGAGNDNLYGGDGNNLLDGGAGNDFIVGGVKNDRLLGGSGHDTLYGEAGNDNLYGSSGNDTLYGQAGNNRLYGEAGNDKLHGHADDDSLYGGDGKDILRGADGKAFNDRLDGGNMRDTCEADSGDTITNCEGTPLVRDPVIQH